jgi:leucyl aminopeptidase
MNPTRLKKPILLFCALFFALLVCIFTSDYSRLLTSIELDTYQYPTKLHHTVLNPILEELNITDIENDLRTLIEDLPSNRYFKSENGYAAGMHIKETLRSLVEGIKSETVRSMFEVVEFNHPWRQPSILLKLRAPGNARNKAIVIGCHIDSINMSLQENAPGVDDNLSGIVIVLQTIKQVILAIENRGLLFKNDIEFHFYAAEEMGSIGSTQLFHQYRQENREIVAMFQQDMTGYTMKTLDAGEKEHFGLITDYTSEGLMRFTKLIIDNYCSIPYRETQCGKICSDHISGLMYGYPSTYVLESAIEYSNPFIHTDKDTIELIDFNHMKEHLKLTLSLTVELAVADNLEIVHFSHGFRGDIVAFRYIDFLILLMMHHTKRFIYSVILFAASAGALFNIYLEVKHVPLVPPTVETVGPNYVSTSKASVTKHQRKRK